MINGCFDVHFALARFDTVFHLDYFLRKIREDRKELLQKSWPQVKETLQEYRRRDYKNVPVGAELLLNLETTNDDQLLEILLEPKEDPSKLANLLYMPIRGRNYFKDQKKPMTRRVPKPRVSLTETPCLPVPEFQESDTFIPMTPEQENEWAAYREWEASRDANGIQYQVYVRNLRREMAPILFWTKAEEDAYINGPVLHWLEGINPPSM